MRGISYKSIDVLDKIYQEVFKQIREKQTNIFLCGGAKTNPDCIRDKVRDSFIKHPNITVLYPEDMFIEMLDKDKNSDLLSYEKFLANNADYICIICESPGSLVELGAFVNNENTCEKVIAVVDEKRSRDKSFIMLGPIKYIRKKNGKDSIIFYNKENVEKAAKDLLFSIKNNKKNYKSTYDIDTLRGVGDFIELLLYFYSKITYKDLISNLEYLWSKYSISILDKNTLINASLRLLFKNKLICKQIQNEESYYQLNTKGYDEMKRKMYLNKNIQKSKLYDSIKFAIMYNEFYNNSSSLS